MKPKEKILDVAFQKLSHGQRCFNCHRPATEIHHIKPRSCKLNRWNKKNALPICRKCHFDLHNGALENPSVEFERDNIKDYLLRNGLIYDEFLQLKMKEFGI